MKKLYKKIQRTNRKLNRKVRGFKWYDISLTKLAVAAFVLFIIRVWPAAMTWVHGVNWVWFLVAAVIFAILPTKKFRNS